MSQLPAFYEHIHFDTPGGPEVMSLKRSALPSPGAGQVLIRVAAAGVNGPDLAQRKGAYPPPSGASPILGLEVAGEVVALGAGLDTVALGAGLDTVALGAGLDTTALGTGPDTVALGTDVGTAAGVRRLALGDKVCALVPGGGYGEYVLTHASHCLPLPRGMSMTEAACLPETFFTVWGNLFMRGKLKAGETLLVQGGSGGIGSTAILLARAFGARVLVTCSTDEKREYCLGLGAELAFDYRDEQLIDKVLAATHGRGVDLVLDMAGGAMINTNFKLLADDGRLVSVAMQSGPKAEVDIFRLMMKRLVWTGSTLRPQSDAAKAAIAAELYTHVWPLLERGECRLPIFATFPLAEAAEAHRLMESKAHQGKVCLLLPEAG